MFLARKISFPKWKQRPDLAEGELRADAVTADLRTVDDALSVWQCGDNEATEKDVQEAALAMASIMDRADTIDLAWLDKDELEQAGHIVRQTSGHTNVLDLRSHHFDICALDYTRLGDIASRIAKAARDGQCHRFRRRAVLDLLADAVELCRIKVAHLKCPLRQQVQDHLDERDSQRKSQP